MLAGLLGHSIRVCNGYAAPGAIGPLVDDLAALVAAALVGSRDGRFSRSGGDALPPPP
jgi:hypothetical protein